MYLFVTLFSLLYLFSSAYPLATHINIQDQDNNINNKVTGSEPYEILIASAQQNTNFSKLEYLCDTFGPRWRGTVEYTNALNWIIQTMIEEGLENVVGENVTGITNWIRGEESLTMISPRPKNMLILGLGPSVGTGSTPITAEVLVVHSFDELANRSAEAKGKIVVYNVPFTTYGDTVQYRVFGAVYAAKAGALAALVRTIAPFSLYTPHTGSTVYETGITPIPTAEVTIEDAELMDRCQARGQKVVVSLSMGATTGAPVTERNILAEVVGSENPEQIVLMGGHSDSWDVGQGAMDDGGGLFSSWEALRIIHDAVKSGLIPRPKRTIRVVLWTDEELNQSGAKAYAEMHAAELKYHVLAIESDSGNFVPTGFNFSINASNPILQQAIQQVGQHLATIGAGNITLGNGEDTDNGFLYPTVPCMSLISEGFMPILNNPVTAYYFFYHHSNADTITALNYDGLANSAAALAVLTYYVANM